MIRNLLLGAALGSAGLATAGGAAAQKLEYDCDTPAEHFSQLKLAGDAPSRGVSGKITAHAFYRAGKFMPFVSARLDGPAGWSVRIGLSGLAQTGPQMMMTAELTTYSDGRLSEKKQFVGPIDASAPIAFALTIGPDGTGTAMLGGYTLRFSPPPGATSAAVACSTGDFLYSELELLH